MDRGGRYRLQLLSAKIVNLFDCELEADKPEEERAGYCRLALRVGPLIGASRLGLTVYELAEGERVCPYHYEFGDEEWLFVFEGEPVLRTPEGERKLGRGDVVCFPAGPEGAHDVTGPARIGILSTKRDPAVAIYPDSDKLGAWPPNKIFRLGDAVDYFEGER